MFSSSQIWSYEYFFYQQALGRTIMFNGPANLRKFHRRRSDKFYSKDPYFRYRKTFRNRVEIRQDRYFSKRGLSNLSPFGSLSHGVFFFLLTSFSGEKAYEYYGCSCWKS